MPVESAGYGSFPYGEISYAGDDFGAQASGPRVRSDQHVTTRTLNWKEIVMKRWGKEWTEPEIGYEFGKRKFLD